MLGGEQNDHTEVASDGAYRHADGCRKSHFGVLYKSLGHIAVRPNDLTAVADAATYL